MKYNSKWVGLLACLTIFMFCVVASAGVKSSRVGNSMQYFMPAFSPGTSQVKAYTATTSQSAALASTTKMIRVVATTNAHIKIGTNPTAVADGTSMYLPLGVAVFIAVDGSEKVAVIRDTADGNLFITEATNAY